MNSSKGNRIKNCIIALCLYALVVLLQTAIPMNISIVKLVLFFCLFSANMSGAILYEIIMLKMELVKEDENKIARTKRTFKYFFFVCGVLMILYSIWVWIVIHS